jgi:melanoma-associated antigen
MAEELNSRSCSQELLRKASDLVRFALFMEHKRTLIRREDINKKGTLNSQSSFT